MLGADPQHKCRSSVISLSLTPYLALQRSSLGERSAIHHILVMEALPLVREADLSASRTPRRGGALSAPWARPQA